jgi:hypothetical protein
MYARVMNGPQLGDKLLTSPLGCNNFAFRIVHFLVNAGHCSLDKRKARGSRWEGGVLIDVNDRNALKSDS